MQVQMHSVLGQLAIAQAWLFDIFRAAFPSLFRYCHCQVPFLPRILGANSSHRSEASRCIVWTFFRLEISLKTHIVHSYPDRCSIFFSH